MTTVAESDVVLPRRTADEDPNAQTRAPARARVAVTDGGGKLLGAVARDLADGWAQTANSWVLRQSPPPLRQVAAGSKPSNAAIDHPILMAGHAVWGFAIAVPITALLYTIAWLFQHPARGLTAAIITVLIVAIWASS